mmetsp:Transcript_12100/g.33410  ORF Transcript_12100/g.33410 Transcript_12100/m.33410 type:complete len:327 (+) Transcript_12100:434-1414(+)
MRIPSHPSGLYPFCNIAGIMSFLRVYAYSASVRHACDSLYRFVTHMTMASEDSIAAAIASSVLPIMRSTSIQTVYPSSTSSSRSAIACVCECHSYDSMICVFAVLPPPVSILTLSSLILWSTSVSSSAFNIQSAPLALAFVVSDPTLFTSSKPSSAPGHVLISSLMASSKDRFHSAAAAYSITRSHLYCGSSSARTMSGTAPASAMRRFVASTLARFAKPWRSSCASNVIPDSTTLPSMMSSSAARVSSMIVGSFSIRESISSRPTMSATHTAALIRTDVSSLAAIKFNSRSTQPIFLSMLWFAALVLRCRNVTLAWSHTSMPRRS